MESHDVQERDDRCFSGKCWTGPVLAISSKGGAVIDVRTWIQVMLSHHHNKPNTLSMMARLSMEHIREEHVILAVASDPSVLREIFARVMLDHGGVLKSNCSSYIFDIVGAGERERCNSIIEHYAWINGLKTNSSKAV